MSKQRVASGAADERFQSQKFSNAPAIFANNDVKYETNKVRARRFATERKDVITYAVAKDTPSAQALRERPGLSGEKLSWLNRHDRESGDLYGMLPLIPNMPMALTDHIDRSPDKQLLRGTVGYLHSWVLASGEQSVVENGVRILEKLPIVFLKFPNATWTLEGLTEPGLYPIKLRTNAWYLDKGRKHPVLKISRKQLPLAPAFVLASVFYGSAHL